MERRTFQVQQGTDVSAWGRNGNFRPAEIAVSHWEDDGMVNIAVYGKRGAISASLDILKEDAEYLATLLLGCDFSKLYQYQEVIRDGEAEYGCALYVEADSEEQAFELAMQYLVFNYGGGFAEEEVHSYKEFLIEGHDDWIELPDDYRNFGVENLRKVELSDIISKVQGSRIDRYPIPQPSKD